MALKFPNPTLDFFNALMMEQDIHRYLTKLYEHHSDTYCHSLRVSMLSIDVGLENDLRKDELRILGLGGLLHDIGKAHIPLTVLAKPAALDEEEQKIMHAHTRLGFLSLNAAGYEFVRRIVLRHHEYKQHAYPRAGKDRRGLPLIGERDHEERRTTDTCVDTLTQIVAAADIYDALISRRAYKDPLPREKVAEVMREQFRGDSRYVEQVLQR